MTSTRALTAGEVVNRVKAVMAVQGVQWNDGSTRDRFKFGGPDTVVTGIATTFMGTFEAISKATALGLKNLDRVLDSLVSATTNLGEDFSLLEDTYKAVLTHRRKVRTPVADRAGLADERDHLEARLEVRRRNVLPASGDDELFLAVDDAEVAVLVDRADVAGVEPAFLV